MKNQASRINSNVTGGDTRLSRKWAGFFCALILSAICLLPGMPLLAQYDSAQINGTIRDQAGAMVPNAAVQIQNRDTGFTRQTVTNSAGVYVLSQIPPGVYKITASSSGFSSVLQDGVALVVSQSATFDFVLKPGSATQTVEVSSDSVTLDTTSTTLGATLETESINNLPTLGRNVSALILLNPGVSPINDDTTGNGTNPVGQLYSPSIQGFNNRSNTYMLDGVNNNEAVTGSEIITPIPDDIQEMKLVAHSDSAQFGEGLGGTINMITKSGTNHFHGAGWEFWRSSEFLDAPNFPTGQLADLHQNQFGGDVGGPVRIPFYNGKNRTFFYGSYEGYRQETGAQTLQLVPVAANYSGDFSNLLAQGIQLYNPFTPNRDPFVNNQIGSYMDPRLVQYAKSLYPLPNGTWNGGADNYLNVTPSTHNSDQYDIRGDEYLTKKDLVWAHYLHQNDPITSYGGVPNLINSTGYVAHNFGAQWVHTFSPASILTVAFGQNFGAQVANIVYNGDVAAINAAAGFASAFNCGYIVNPRCVLPGATINGYMGEGEQLSTGGGLSRIWETKADYEHIIKRHTIFVGFNIDTNNKGQSASAGSGVNFGTFQTSNGSMGGDSFASFLMSLPDTANRSNSSSSESGGWVDGVYAQDQWKVRDNLTINLGLRYDLSIIPVIHNPAGDYYDIYDFTNGTDVLQKLPPPCSTTVFAPCLPGGTLPPHVVISSQPGKLFFSDKKNIQPRFGASYAVRQDSVIHAAWGRAYDNWTQIEQFASGVNSWILQTNQEVVNLNNEAGITPATQITAQNPMTTFVGNYPAAAPWGSVTWNTPPQTKVGYSDQWTFGVQQKVADSNVWTINYVGAKGSNLDYAPIANTALPGPGPVSPRTPFPYMGQSYYDQPIGKLNYNALQTSFQGKNRASGLTYLVAYTWSKGLNYGVDGSSGVGTSSIQNPYCFKCDYGVTGLDLTNVFTAGWVWEVPFGKGRFSTGNRLADYALGNWQINGIATMQSGQPFTVFDSGDIANTGNFDWVGGGYERPNVVGNPNANRHSASGQWINPAAYATPAPYTFGDSARNSLRTEPLKRLDTSLFREFPLAESWKLQLRMDVFNAFNHPVWGIPNKCENCSFFGIATSSVQQSREVQLSGKIVF